jgi:hypothetical protein
MQYFVFSFFVMCVCGKEKRIRYPKSINYYYYVHVFIDIKRASTVLKSFETLFPGTELLVHLFFEIYWGEIQNEDGKTKPTETSKAMVLKKMMTRNSGDR